MSAALIDRAIDIGRAHPASPVLAASRQQQQDVLRILGSSLVGGLLPDIILSLLTQKVDVDEDSVAPLSNSAFNWRSSLAPLLAQLRQLDVLLPGGASATVLVRTNVSDAVAAALAGAETVVIQPPPVNVASALP